VRRWRTRDDRGLGRLERSRLLLRRHRNGLLARRLRRRLSLAMEIRLGSDSVGLGFAHSGAVIVELVETEVIAVVLLSVHRDQIHQHTS
jgi:hypothetical protein